MQKTENLQNPAAARLEAVIAQVLEGRLGYDGLLDGFGRALSEGAELLVLRDRSTERKNADGTAVFAEIDGQFGKAWAVFTGEHHVEPLRQHGTVSTAVLSLKTLLDMAEDSSIDELMFNPDQAPNLELGIGELFEIRSRAEQYEEAQRQQRLRRAGSSSTPGWIM